MMRLALAILVVLLSGCGYSAPTLRVVDIRLTERTEAGIVVDVIVDAENRNEVELPLRDVLYTVTLENGWTFSGVRSPEASLRRLGVQQFRVPAVFPLSPDRPAPTGELGCRVTGRLGYTAPGQFAQDLFDSGVRRPSVSFSGEGRLRFDSPP